MQQQNYLISILAYSKRSINLYTALTILPSNLQTGIYFLKYSNEHYKAIVKRVSQKKKYEKSLSKSTIKDLGPNSENENENSRDCSTGSLSEEDIAEVQDFHFDLGMEEDESMRKAKPMEKSKLNRTPPITRNGSPT